MIYSILFGPLLLAGVAHDQANAVTPAIARYLATFDSAGQLSGTVLVARGADIILEQSFGRADHTRKTPNSATTLFAVASITKPLTGIAARMLVERGALRAEDPVAQWIPDFPNGGRITIAHLLAHRSGIPHRVTTLADERQDQTAESMVSLISRASLLSEPGAQRLYSSAGYSLLAAVLERASGKSYAALLRELVLQPAGAANTVDATERPAAANLPKGHFWTPTGPHPAQDKKLSFLVGAGSLWTTPRDLFKLVRRIADGGFSAAATAGARTPNGAIQWTGFSNGFQAIVSYDPASNVTVIVTSNLLTGAPDAIVRDVPRILAGETVQPVVPRPAPVALSEQRRRQLEGLYDFGGNQQQLTFVSPTTAILGGEYGVVATSDTTFFAPQNYAELRVVSGTDGSVASLDFRGVNMSMRRVR